MILVRGALVLARVSRVVYGATDPKAASANPAALRAANGVTQDIRGYYMSGKATYDPSRITAPTLMIQAEWDHDTPPYMSQALFPLLTHAAWKQYDLIGEGTIRLTYVPA